MSMSEKSVGVVKKESGEVSSFEWPNTVVLDGISAIQMPFGPMDVQSYAADGFNLIINLNSGAAITIEKFFAKFGKNSERSELVLEDAEGVSWLGQFDPAVSEFTFTEISTLDTGVEEAAGVLADIPDWALIGLSVLAVGGVAVAASSGGGGGSSSSKSPDEPTPPVPPSPAKNLKFSEDDAGEKTATVSDETGVKSSEVAVVEAEDEEELTDSSTVAVKNASEELEISSLNSSELDDSSFTHMGLLSATETDSFDFAGLDSPLDEQEEESSLSLSDVVSTDSINESVSLPAAKDEPSLFAASPEHPSVDTTTFDLHFAVDPLSDLLDENSSYM